MDTMKDAVDEKKAQMIAEAEKHELQAKDLRDRAEAWGKQMEEHFGHLFDKPIAEARDLLARFVHFVGL